MHTEPLRLFRGSEAVRCAPCWLHRSWLSFAPIRS
ncbi:hypothetical protein DWY05_07945 [Collinsella sp. AF23-4AC]|nr:hypothetical protein DWY06_07420 [Collinsella sp. AF23-6]RGS21907.1 hypothetical protein DWY05_07945 [Collinsella sp. AF23-4AC]